MGVETEQFLLVTKNLHEILFHLLTITEHSLPLDSIPALPDSAAFQFFIAPKRQTTEDTMRPKQLSAVSSAFPFPVSEIPGSRLTCSTIPPQGSEKVKALWEKLPKMAGHWKKVLHEVSPPCAEVLDLETLLSVQRDLW